VGIPALPNSHQHPNEIIVRRNNDLFKIAHIGRMYEARDYPSAVFSPGPSVRIDGAAASIGSQPIRSYSAITCAPRSSTKAPISTLNRTAIDYLSADQVGHETRHAVIQWYSTVALRPSKKPVSLRPLRKAATYRSDALATHH
jgi:hypothetical protein